MANGPGDITIMAKLFLCRRDQDEEWSDDNCYEIASVKKGWNVRTGFPNPIEIFCPSEWEKVTGFKLEPGHMTRITLTVDHYWEDGSA